MAGWVRWVARHPRTALAGLAGLALVSLLAARTIAVDTDSSRMLDPELPFQARAQAVTEAFPALKNAVVVVVRSPRADPADAAVAFLRERLIGAPSVETVFAAAADPFFASHGLLYLSEAELDAQLTRISKSSNMLAELRSDPTLTGFLRALSEAQTLAEQADIAPGALERLYGEAAAVIESEGAAPRGFAWREVFAGEGAVTRVLTLSPELDFTAINPARAAMRAVEAAIAELPPEIAAEVEIGITGDPVLRAEELRSVTATLGISLALSLVLVGAVLRLSLGSFARMGLALGALVLSLLYTAGFAVGVLGALNLVSIAFIVLMVGLGIDFAIHLMAHVEEEAALRPTEDALATSAAALGPALVLTAATTAAAFLAFTATEFIGMAQLGTIGAVGVGIAFAVAVTLIPAVLALRPSLARAPGAAAPRREPRPVRAKGRWRAAACALGVGVGACFIAPSARFDADPMALRNPEARSVEVYRWLNETPRTAPLRLSLIAADEAEAAAAAERLAALPEVRSAVSLADFIPAAQDAKLDLIDIAWPSLDFAVNGEPVDLGTGPEVPPDAAALAEALPEEGAAGRLAAALEAFAAAETPERRAALEARLFRYFPALVASLEAQLAVDRITPEALPAPLIERYRAPDGRLRVEILPAEDITGREAREAFVAAVHSVAPEAGGAPDQIASSGSIIAGAMLKASLIALGVSALLALALVGRALTMAAILAPVVLAGAITAAASVVLGMPFNYANVIVLPLLIGLGIDAGVHLALRAGQDPAVFATSTPRAVLASALTTIGAFATLALSEHAGTASMGVMLAVAVTAAVVMAFALTPALMRLARVAAPER